MYTDLWRAAIRQKATSRNCQFVSVQRVYQSVTSWQRLTAYVWTSK